MQDPPGPWVFAMTLSISYLIWSTVRLYVLSSGVKGQFRGFSPQGDHAQPDVSLVADM